MTEQDQQIALCEWFGLERVNEVDGIPCTAWFNGRVHIHDVRNLPNTNSLDVLHEMEKKLTVEQASDYYWKLKEIQPVVGSKPCEHWVYHCTAAQRREALLRVLNLLKA